MEDTKPSQILRSATPNDFFEFLDSQPQLLKQDWLVDGIISAGGNTLLAADQKFGKTYFNLFLALAVASGKPFFNKNVLLPGPVFLHSPEGSRRLLGNRLKEVAEVMRLNVNDLPLIISQEHSLSLNNKLDQERIEEQLFRSKFVLQIFDPLKDCFQGSLYSEIETKNVDKFLRYVNTEYGVSNFIAHHMVKSVNADPTKNVKGDGGWTAMMDDIITGKKHGIRGRSLTFEQRQGMSHHPIYFKLPEIVGEPMSFEICKKDDIESEGAEKRIEALSEFHLKEIKDNDKGWLVSELRSQKEGSNSDHSKAINGLENEGCIIRIRKKIYLHPKFGGKNQIAVEYLESENGQSPKNKTKKNREKGQKDDGVKEKVLSEKEPEAVQENNRTEVETPNSFTKKISSFFKGDGK